ncbi:hypothetical protein ACFFQF_11845 [Haladaptatus pallidirubidus]|uniref:Molybdopterin cofactor biosynthesis MoaD-related C-terminal domain-containing protein n=1 Tax=Haladaptatus pallidirubidus TaxID=1008152 RepID=A0AAV3UEG8_9EURY|nr:hypothetical protein [Haladaptatus pallidirubidus]
MRREKSFRGINERLARVYLENLGGEVEEDGDVSGDGWRASLSSEKVEIGPTVELTEITVVFEGNEETLDSLVDDFSQKAMRAGG